jgi:hypothetical protein
LFILYYIYSIYIYNILYSMDKCPALGPQRFEPVLRSWQRKRPLERPGRALHSPATGLASAAGMATWMPWKSMDFHGFTMHLPWITIGNESSLGISGEFRTFAGHFLGSQPLNFCHGQLRSSEDWIRTGVEGSTRHSSAGGEICGFPQVLHPLFMGHLLEISGNRRICICIYI